MIDWVPGTGTVITVKGVPQGEPFKEPEFFNALLRIWLGPNPADWKLKDALLGQPGLTPARPASASESTKPSASTPRTGSPWL